LKALIKTWLPVGITDFIGNLRANQRERQLGSLSVGQAFDQVYRTSMWKRGNSTSGPGSEGPLAQRYITVVLDYASRHGLRTVVDAGCGDFTVGSILAPHFERYTAFDASQHIIETNRQRYAHLTDQNVTFTVADMTSEVFPEADLILIRQVFQHLTNAQIERALENLEASKWRRALVTEEVFDPSGNSSPNVDLPSHTFRTRVAQGSGVFLDKLPFVRKTTPIAVIDDAAVEPGRSSSLLICELNSERVIARAATSL
jgi:hypothetical protein